MNCTAVALKFWKFESMCFTAYTILGCNYIHDRIIGGVPKNLIKGGRNFLLPFPLKISIKTKKKLYTFFDVKFAPQKQVKAEKKKGKVLTATDVKFTPTCANQQKNVIASPDVLFPLFRWL